jgi:flagellum-specific peptidoglycan hydrolase FlgJ
VVERMQREITPQEYAAMLREAMAKKQAEIRRKALARQAEEEAMKKGPRPKPAQRTAGMSILFDKKPSISAEYIDWELRKHKSPAAGMGAEMVRLGERYGIDPAFALAKFRSESTYGTSGVARTTKSVGNLRGTGPAGGYKGFRRYNKWAEGLEDLYRLMAKDRRYLKAGRTTVEGIVPVYAPPHENPTGEIINRVRGFMGRYREEYQRGLHLKNSH